MLPFSSSRTSPILQQPKKKKKQTNQFFSPKITGEGGGGQEEAGHTAVLLFIRLERLPRGNSIKAGGTVGNSMQIAPKAAQRKAAV